MNVSTESDEDDKAPERVDDINKQILEDLENSF